MGKKFLGLFFMFVLVFSLVNVSFAQTYYADLDIYVENDGSVTFSGLTNYEPFQNVVKSQKFTSKNGDYWILNLNTEDIFDTYVFNLYLPNGAVANYIKTTKNIKFDEQDGRSVIIGKDLNKPLRLMVQYKILDDNSSSNSQTSTMSNNQMFILLGFGIFLVFLVLVIFIYVNTKSKPIVINSSGENNEIIVENGEEHEEENKEKYDISILPKRQQEIIDILKKKDNISQKELENLMQIPKSSVSRNLRTLEIKGIVKKEQIGHTNYISLK